MDQDEVPVLASVADRFQMTEVTSLLEEVLMGQLSVDMCWDVLIIIMLIIAADVERTVWDATAGSRSPGESVEMAAERF